MTAPATCGSTLVALRTFPLRCEPPSMRQTNSSLETDISTGGAAGAVAIRACASVRSRIDTTGCGARTVAATPAIAKSAETVSAASRCGAVVTSI